jgi:hypothetical protein
MYTGNVKMEMMRKIPRLAFVRSSLFPMSAAMNNAKATNVPTVGKWFNKRW